MVWLITLLSCGTLPMKALCCRKRHGWFLTWPLCLNTEWWRLVFHKLKKLKFNTSKQVRGFLHSESLYQWLVTASSLDCRCYKPGNPLVANFDECWKPRKTAKNRKPLGNRVWLTHMRAHGDVVSLPEVIASLLASILCRATSWRDRQLSTPRRSQALLQTRQFSGARWTRKLYTIECQE